MKMQKYVAEMLGAFTLTLAVSWSIINGFALATPLVAGLTLGLFVYTVGPVSGAHLNPAVTLGLLAVRKIKVNDAVLYILFQIVGALLAMLLTNAVAGGVTGVEAGDSWLIVMAEAIGAFILVWGVSSVVQGKVDDDACGIVIGGALLLGVLLAASFSNGVINPAVAIGIGSVSASYILAPILGGVVSALAYRWLVD